MRCVVDRKVVAANIEIDSAGARDGADDRKVPRRFLAEYPAVSKRFWIEGVSRIIRAISEKSRSTRDDRLTECRPLGRSQDRIAGRPEPRCRASSAFRNTARRLKQRFLEARRIRCGHAETHVGAQSTDIRDVADKPLEFQSNQTKG